MRCQIIQTSETHDFMIKTLIRRVSVWKLFTCIHEVISWVLLRFPATFKRNNVMSNEYKFAWCDGAAWLPEESEINRRGGRISGIAVTWPSWKCCWSSAAGTLLLDQDKVTLIWFFLACRWKFADVFLQTLFPSNILHASILHIAMFAYKRQKQTLQADFFFSVLFWIISKRFIAIFLRGRCSRLPVPASFFTLRTVWWQAASETEVKKDSRVSQKRWRFCTVSKREDGLWRLE